MLTSPLYWVALTVLLLVTAFHTRGQWRWLVVLGGAGLVSLLYSVWMEGGGGLLERVRLAQAERHFALGAAGALVMLSVAGAAVGLLFAK